MSFGSSLSSDITVIPFHALRNAFHHDRSAVKGALMQMWCHGLCPTFYNMITLCRNEQPGVKDLNWGPILNQMAELYQHILCLADVDQKGGREPPCMHFLFQLWLTRCCSPNGWCFSLPILVYSSEQRSGWIHYLNDPHPEMIGLWLVSIYFFWCLLYYPEAIYVYLRRQLLLLQRALKPSQTAFFLQILFNNLWVLPCRENVLHPKTICNAI